MTTTELSPETEAMKPRFGSYTKTLFAHKLLPKACALFLIANCFVSICSGGQSLPAFSVIPANELKDPQTPGRDYFLSKHRLRLELALKISARYELDEEAKPEDAKFEPQAEVSLSEINLTSVRDQDRQHHYFMAFKQVSAFLRQKKFTMNFTDDGFLSGAEFAFEDQTLTILTELAKTAAIAMAPATPEQNQKEAALRAKRAMSAFRFKNYIEALELQLLLTQSNLVVGITNKTLTEIQVAQTSEGLEKLRTELSAAKSSRESLTAYGSKSDVLSLTIYLDEIGPDGWSYEPTTGKSSKTISLNWGQPLPGYSLFESKVRSAFGKLSSKVLSDVEGKLPEAVKLTMDGEYKHPSPSDVFSKKIKPFKGIIYRRPRNVAAAVLLKDQPIYTTDGATLKFGQLGEVVALPIKVKAFMKGELTIGLSPDGEIAKLGSGASSALGASAVSTASSLLSTYQAIQKKEAGGGLDTELLNAENAKLKAQIDNINNRKTLNDLQNPE